MTADGFFRIVRDRLAELGESSIACAQIEGLPSDAIRSVLRGEVPTIGWAAETCRALDLEFTITQPRREGLLTRRMEPRLSFPADEEGVGPGHPPSDARLRALIRGLGGRVGGNRRSWSRSAGIAVPGVLSELVRGVTD